MVTNWRMTGTRCTGKHTYRGMQSDSVDVSVEVIKFSKVLCII